ncbi:MAG: N-acetyltransferase [Alphaproteobacteria bacterium]|nr:MAG: N-acetyltransferase [Alphaproteobacteria bacterium]
MPETVQPTVQVRVLESARSLDGGRWDTLAGTANPFLSHAFMTALEDSGAAAAAVGWRPFHLLAEDETGQALALMPAYLKSHSYGEYVFDHGWAAAYERAGGRYYPKLQSCVPFTPVTGPRLLAASPAAATALVVAAKTLVERHGLSGLHVTFPEQAELPIYRAQGLLIRTDQQFHWRNAGYRDFADFLDALSSRKRKTLRRERQAVQQAGIAIAVLTGGDLTEAAWDSFFAFYMDTASRKWGRPYLNRRFFSLLGERLGKRVVLMLAMRGGRAIAGALNLLGDDTLYGRYWGALEYHPFLHFELCYYQAIDYALAHGLSRVEAGAQGEHKLARGYQPVKTYSAHWLRDPRFQAAVARFLEAERREVDAAIDYLGTTMPFKKPGR